MTHPCEGHPCDHCYLCDVLGICCITVATGQHVPPQAKDIAQADTLHDAIAQDAKTVIGVTELVRLDAQRQRLGGALSAPSRLALPITTAEPVLNDTKKEAVYVAPRAPQ
jgi:hypothetical protein